MIKCPLTGSSNTRVIYSQKQVPYVQNMVFPSKQGAQDSLCVDVILAQSLDNGFVFSANSNETVIDYDAHYQNEQSNSGFFRDHLRNVIALMQQHHLLDGKVVEIGCGKGYFMDMLLDRGADVTGFDPTYEGESPRVVKDFFSDKYSDVNADFIVLRHTLEHITEPFHFIKSIAAANNNKGKIYIEVPTFEWIVRNAAVEDIFHEHTNYFTLDTLQMFFKESIGGEVFNGQYIYVIADLGKIKEEIEKRDFVPYRILFEEKMVKYDKLIEELSNVAVWGAGAKGSTFLNLLDKKAERIKCVIDMNPKKQHQYLGGTGHYIIRPEEIAQYNIENIIVMNINYFDEIKEMIGTMNVNLIKL